MAKSDSVQQAILSLFLAFVKRHWYNAITMQQKNTLNTAQKKAIEYVDGPLLIVAGAGTGKTTVITKKIEYLIESGRAKPEEILALTFTDKAAEEMVDRTNDLLDLGYVDLHISTFHSFCQTLLERYGLDTGLPPRFRTFTQTDAWLFVQHHLYDLGLSYYLPMGNPTHHIHALLDHFSKCKDELITPSEYMSYAESATLDSDVPEAEERSRLLELARAYHAYNQMLLGVPAMDFGDLMCYTVQLLRERPAILLAVQKQFKHILIDEFQDVNYAQYELVRLLCGSNNQLTVVGDDDQSIYAFRGASVSNILRFKEDFLGTKEIVLTENYRSGQIILDAAYAIIQHNNPDRLEVKLHIDKKLKQHNKKMGDGMVTHLHYETIDDEVRGVVEKIQELRANASAEFNDIAILVRANSQATPFIHALESVGIPYEYRTSSGLFRQHIVMDCIAVLRAIVNTYDDAAFFRILRMPHLGISEHDIQYITHMAKKKTIRIYDILRAPSAFGVPEETGHIVIRLAAEIDRAIKAGMFEKPTAVLVSFLEQNGMLAHLTHAEESSEGRAMRNIHYLKQFFEFLNRYQEVMPGVHVHDVAEHIALTIASGDEGSLYQPTDTPDSVHVMTAHASKGLEFRYVFIVNCVEERFPTRRKGGDIELPIALVKEQLPEGDYHYQEERRLFYVAMTRAKECLFFTGADGYGGVRKKKVSRFLEEINMIQTTAPKAADVSTPFFSAAKAKHTFSDRSFSYVLPKTFSFSQIRSFDVCPYQYKILHVLKVPMSGSHYFSFGNTIHLTLQRFYEEVQTKNAKRQASLFGPIEPIRENTPVEAPSLDRLLELYEAAWIPDWYVDKKQRESYAKKGRELLRTLYKENEHAWTVPIAIESGFTIKLGGYLIRGKIDRIDMIQNGSLEIIDYKTGAAKETLSTEDKQQLLLYQKAAETLPEYRNIGAVEQLTYYYVVDNTKVSFKGTNKAMAAFEKKMEDILNTLHTTDFHTVTREDGCGRCEVCWAHI